MSLYHFHIQPAFVDKVLKVEVQIPSDVPRLVDVLKVRAITEEIDGHMFSKSSAVHYLLCLLSLRWYVKTI